MLSKSLRRSFTAFTRVRFKLPHTNSYSSDINVESATDKHLRQDINQLGSILSTAIRGESVSFFESVEKLRVLGHERRDQSDPSNEPIDKMVKKVKGYSSTKLLIVSRAFTHFLALYNAAENTNRIRSAKLRLLHEKYGLPSERDSCGGCISRLLKEGHPKNMIYEQLCNQSVEIVLTAHPTEINRPTILRKHLTIQELLESLSQPNLTEYDRELLELELQRNIGLLWRSDEIIRRKPTPLDEASNGSAIIEHVAWKALPNFLRKLDFICRSELGKPLPLTARPIKISSWMGGDRDGNPNVTPAVTLEVSLTSHRMAMTLLLTDIKKLRSDLSLTSGTRELMAATHNAKEPYRFVLKELEERIRATLDSLDARLHNTPRRLSGEPIQVTGDILKPLIILHESLVATNNKIIADGLLTDVIRRLVAFGVGFLPLDIRQEAARHTQALDAITRFLEIGSYAEWNEETRQKWLLTELSSKRPLFPSITNTHMHFGFCASVLDTLKTFELAASLGSESLGAYVISHCQEASDVLAVMLLKQNAGIHDFMRVVPLFETLSDLTHSPSVVESLFSSAVYRSKIDNHQEIMVGYSDLAKDAGRVAASWAQYKAQEDIIDVSSKYGIEITFFHGKGGAIGRGGNAEAFKAILAHPPNTIHGRFRVTEQGEMISQNLGRLPIAERTFDLFTAGVLVDYFQHVIEPKQEWREMMDTLSDISCAAYRHVVRDEPKFLSYFASATPELELAALACTVSSRPVTKHHTMTPPFTTTTTASTANTTTTKGQQSVGVDDIRSIPWVFAWTQTRLNLPAWLGVGEAIFQVINNSDTNLKLLQAMYVEWPWFQTLIDLVEMILVKSDVKIAENYDQQLVTDVECLQLGADLRLKFNKTVEAVLLVSGHSSLQAHNQDLLQSLHMRNPHLDALNVLQAEILKRLRTDDVSLLTIDKETDTDVECATADSDSVAAVSNSVNRHAQSTSRNLLADSLLITIKGIANGMRNSG